MDPYSSDLMNLKTALRLSDYNVVGALRKFVIQETLYCVVRQASQELFHERFVEAHTILAEAEQKLAGFLHFSADDRISYVTQWQQQRLQRLEQKEQKDAQRVASAKTELASLPQLMGVARWLAQEGMFSEALCPDNDRNLWIMLRKALHDGLLSQFRAAERKEKGEEESAASLQQKSTGELVAMVQEELEQDVRWARERFEKFERARMILENLDAIERELEAQSHKEKTEQ